MAKRVRLKIDKKGIGQMLKGEDDGSKLRPELGRIGRRVKAKAEADPNLQRATVDEREWVGFDRARYTLGIPGSMEARDGILARALGSVRE